VLYYNPRGKAQFDIQDQAGLNLVTKMTYDGLDRLVSTTLPEGYKAHPDYACTAATALDPAKESDCVRLVYETSVNPWANNIQSATRVGKTGSPPPTTTTTYVYDPTVNKPITVTGPPTPTVLAGQVTTVTYDPANGNVASIVPDSGSGGIAPRTRFTYTALGQVASITDPLGTVTTFTYDEAGNRLSMVEDAGPGRLNRTTTYGYNSRGDVVSATDPNGNVTRSEYDAARRLVVITSPGTAAAPGGIVTTNSYDADNRLLQVQQSSAGTVLRTTSATWTPTGKLATATDAKGNVTRYDYDLLDRQVTLTDAMGRVTKFTYDAVSRPLQTSNPEIRKPAFPTEVAPLLTQAWTPDGKLASLTDANGNTTSFEYDDFNRLKRTIYPDPITGAAGTTEEYTYDNADNVTERKNRAGGTFTFGYDTLYRPTSKTPPSGPVVTYGYDLASRPIRTSDTSASITAAVPPGGSTVTYGTTYTYDALNRLTKAVWDPAPTVTAPTAGTLVSFGHSYDKTNRRIGQTVDDNTWLAYPAGAPSTTSYTADKLNRYSAVTGLTPGYDTNGNLTGDGTYTYGYDPENRLVSASGAGNSAAYAYDGRGWRKSRTVSGTATISVTDADNREVLEYDSSTGAILRWYAYALGPNDVLNQMSVPGGTRSNYVPDIQGSVIVSLNSAGALSKSTYQPYGASTAAANPFAYTGQRFDAEAGGIYYYRARHFSPLLGRFLQPDPVGYASGMNLYTYTSNNPLNRKDPTGLREVIQPNPILSDSSPRTQSTDPNLHQAQAALTGCAFGPVGCAAGLGITGLQALGGFLLGGSAISGIILLNEQAKPPEAPATSSPTISPRPDFPPQSGGRSGENVKDIVGPPNSAIPSRSGDRVWITDDKGQVVLDVTGGRTKEVVPGQGFGKVERPPTSEELDLLDKVFPKN
jgi:RHS repeat-associated protein